MWVWSMSNHKASNFHSGQRPAQQQVAKPFQGSIKSLCRWKDHPSTGVKCTYHCYFGSQDPLHAPLSTSRNRCSVRLWEKWFNKCLLELHFLCQSLTSSCTRQSCPTVILLFLFLFAIWIYLGATTVKFEVFWAASHLNRPRPCFFASPLSPPLG